MTWLRIALAGLLAGLAFILNACAVLLIALAWIVMPKDANDSDMGV